MQEFLVSNANKQYGVEECKRRTEHFRTFELEGNFGSFSSTALNTNSPFIELALNQIKRESLYSAAS